MNAAAPQVDYSKKWLVLITVGMGTFLSTVDGTIVTVALPTLVQQLNTDFPTIQWVTLAYLLTVTILLLGMGRLGDMVGKKRPYAVGMALFGLASALCGLAPGVGALIGFRVLQAVGAALIQALGTAIITEAFPPEERGRALGLGGLLVSAGILSGPVLGGILIDNIGWRFIFYVNVPVTFIGLFMVNRFVPSGGQRPGQRFDIAGALTLGISLAALMIALTFGQNWGWADGRTLGLIGVFAVFFAVFILVELRVDQPTVDLTLFRNPQFAISLTMAIIVFIAVASRIIIPFFLEQGQGLSVTNIGFVLAVWPMSMALIAPAAGWLSDKIGSMKISLAGLVVSLVGYWLLGSRISLDLSPVTFALLSIPTGLGVGLFQSPNNSAVMGSVPRERLGLASGFLALTRNMGQLVGIAAIGALWATRTLANVPPEMAGTLTDASAAPPAAIAAGTAETFMALAGVMGVLVLLGLWGVRIENHQRAARFAVSQQPQSEQSA
ncbi:MAG: DHA2 family efflux MFS transporter permease subunit [Anaerolineae bacterium]|nr:DHA2 family efflux MFS transporter permease subunit [Anaerolineae bacterium]